MIRDIANKYGLILVDVEKAMAESGRDDSYLLADGLHPSHGGHVIIANAIIDAIEKYQK